MLQSIPQNPIVTKTPKLKDSLLLLLLLLLLRLLAYKPKLEPTTFMHCGKVHTFFIISFSTNCKNKN
jgi:hypothetical protein